MDTNDSSTDSQAEALLAKIGAKDAEDSGKIEKEVEVSHSDEQADEAQADDEQPEPTDEEESEEVDPEEGEEDDAAVAPEKYKIRYEGKEHEVSLDDLKSGYLMRRDYARKTQEVANARKQFQTHAREAATNLKQQMDEVGVLGQTFLEQLTNIERTTNWEELRRVNPAEYAARQHDIQQRKALLDRTVQAYRAQQAQQSVLSEGEKEQKILEEKEKLLSKIPEWLDERTSTAERGQIAKYLSENGHSDDEIDDLIDHRTLVMARKAMLFDRMQNERSKAKEKILKPVPKFTKPGVVRETNQLKSTQVKLAQRAAKTGKVEAAGDWLASKYR